MADDTQMNLILNTLQEVVDQCSTVVDAAAGYRHKCVQAGFSEEASEHMAVDFHRGLIGLALGGKSKNND